jgi:hypothetical protein
LIDRGTGAAGAVPATTVLVFAIGKISIFLIYFL